MHPFYMLREPVAPPGCPSHWSWSSLEEWRTCPRRWWLTRATWTGIHGRYPARIHRETLPGILVHELIEEFADYVNGTENTPETAEDFVQVLTLFRPRDRARTVLQRLIDRLQRENPRTNIAMLMRAGLVDDCLNQFKRLVSAHVLEFRNHVQLRGQAPSALTVRAGHEIELRTDSPPIMGRLDMLQRGRIVDFKTGSPSPAHNRQLLFYALLYFTVTGLPPQCLTVVYTTTGQSVQLDVPPVAALEQMSRELSEEIDQIVQQLSTGAPPEAQCSVDNCAWCPVKQHCDEYWLDPATTGLRAGALKEHSEETYPATHWCDVQLDTLPSTWEGHGTCVGPGTVNELGPANILIDRGHSPDSGTPRPTGARLLGARISQRCGEWEVTTSPLTEVFWTSVP